MTNYEHNSFDAFALGRYIDSDIHPRKYESEEDRLNCTKVLLKVIGYIYENN